jgi:hypothetical protein
VTWLPARGGLGEGGQREVRPRRAPPFTVVAGSMVVWSSTRGYGQPRPVHHLPRGSRTVRFTVSNQHNHPGTLNMVMELQQEITKLHLSLFTEIGVVLFK